MFQPLKILSWSAWAPALPDNKAWRTWFTEGRFSPEQSASPPNKHVPRMLKRRCSLSSRMILETAHGACEEADVPLDQVHIIYATANGEIPALKVLLESLSVDEPLSPTAFTNCVHHVPTGFLGIVHQHQTISRTISAFSDSFVSAWLEAQCLLQRLPHQPVLLLMADEVPPTPFDQMLEMPPFSYGLALLVGCADPEPGMVRFYRPDEDGVCTTPFHKEPQFDFLKWYNGDAPRLVQDTSFGVVAWEKI